jgi:two-component system nitrogen regulation response regulator GlnG
MSKSAEESGTPPAGEPGLPFAVVVEYVNRLLVEGKPDIYRAVIQEIDRHVLHEVLKHFHGNQFQAAERLGISRMTLRSKLRLLGMKATRTPKPPKQ